jgi:hypothetical protein
VCSFVSLFPRFFSRTDARVVRRFETDDDDDLSRAMMRTNHRRRV